MGDSKQSLVWQKTSALVERLNDLSEVLDDDEDFGLLNQIKESSEALSDQIAESTESVDIESKKLFYEKALTFSYELETELVVLGDLEIISPSSIVPLLNELLSVQDVLKKQL